MSQLDVDWNVAQIQPGLKRLRELRWHIWQLSWKNWELGAWQDFHASSLFTEWLDLFTRGSGVYWRRNKNSHNTHYQKSFRITLATFSLSKIVTEIKFKQFKPQKFYFLMGMCPNLLAKEHVEEKMKLWTSLDTKIHHTEVHFLLSSLIKFQMNCKKKESRKLPILTSLSIDNHI